jgi:hypothetical protein
MKLFINGNNLFTIDKMGDLNFDPENSDIRGEAYPQSMIINLGVQLTF